MGVAPARSLCSVPGTGMPLLKVSINWTSFMISRRAGMLDRDKDTEQE